MLRIRVLSLITMSLLLFLAAACSSETAPEWSPDDEIVAVNFEELEGFDYDNFDQPTNIDNQWLPMQPGNQWIFEGSTDEDGERIPHRIVFTVTDLIKEIDGVTTVVAWIEDYADDELVEADAFSKALGEHDDSLRRGVGRNYYVELAQPCIGKLDDCLQSVLHHGGTQMSLA